MTTDSGKARAWTPGPWLARSIPEGWEWDVVAPRQRIDADDDDPVWFVATCCDDADGATSENNARLIAAAPALFEALFEMTALASGPSGGVTKAQKIAIIAKANAALALAQEPQS